MEVYPSMDVGKRLEAGRILAVYPGAESEEEVLGRQHQILRRGCLERLGGPFQYRQVALHFRRRYQLGGFFLGRCGKLGVDVDMHCVLSRYGCGVSGGV